MMPWWYAMVLLKYSPPIAPVDTWTYENAHKWSEQYPLCNGPSQSPVVLGRRQLVTNLRPKVLAEDGAEEWEVEVKNTGRCVLLDMKADPRARQTPAKYPIVLKSGFETVDGTFNGTFVLEDIHFHWGAGRGTKGSEHAIGRRRSDAEAHFVFFDRAAGSLERAQKQPGKVVVVAILLKRKGKGRTGARFPLLGMEDRMSDIPAMEDAFKFKPDLRKMRDFLRAALARAYVYRGSLTTPPCNPVVTWLVSASEAAVSPELVQGLETELFADKDKRKPLLNNCRPLQSPQRAAGNWGGRVIHVSEAELRGWLSR